jgi:DoxX-like family
MFFVAGDHVDLTVAELGYPVYVLFFLGVFKILGGVVIAAPGFLRLKEWAYAGSFFQIFLAAASIALVGLDPINLVYPVVVLLLTLASWALRPPDRVLL